MAQGLQRDLDATGKVFALKQPSPLLMVRLPNRISQEPHSSLSGCCDSDKCVTQ